MGRASKLLAPERALRAQRVRQVWTLPWRSGLGADTPLGAGRSRQPGTLPPKMQTVPPPQTSAAHKRHGQWRSWGAVGAFLTSQTAMG